MSREMPRGLVIAIDGPSGAGKSTVARMLAERLGYQRIDTGAMYRAVAVMLRDAGLEPVVGPALDEFCENLQVSLENSGGVQRVIANGRDVTELIRTPEVSLITSRISALKPVRDTLVKAQRSMGRDGGVVLEGRDIGTVVFPSAEIKFFLHASPEVRGKRRFDEMAAKGETVTLKETIAAVIQRDIQDSEREIAPLKQAEDAIPVDSSNMGIEEVVGKMEAMVRQKSCRESSL